MVGTVALADLVRVDGGGPVAELIEASTPVVGVEADLPDVAILMTDYNLIAMPVIDADDKPVGMIAVDDVLERLLPEEWRRRSSAA